MPTKEGRQEQEPAIHAYELLKLKQCMKNNARLRQLGLPVMTSMFAQHSVIASKKKNQKTTSKNTTRPSKKSANKRRADMPSGGTKTRQKRVRAAEPTTRTTRSKTNLRVQHDEASSGFSTGGAALSTVEEISANFDNNNINEGAGHQMANGSAEAAIENNIAQEDEETMIANSEGAEGICIRGINMGKGLAKMSRARRGKLAVIIPEGKIRPVVPLIAAKFATECNIAVRNHVPVLKSWKEYKKQPEHLKNFIGKLAAKFDINIKDPSVQKACSEMMKKAIRQQRYRLKLKYFDPFPLNMVSKTSPVKSMTHEQWNQLVELWKNPKKMAISEKNKANRAEVKFHQTTGSRSYMVHCENLGEKYDDEDPNALDYFKECHYSKKKKGYTPSVQSAIEQMEKKIAEAADVSRTCP